MVTLTSAQRQDVYWHESARAGIHGAILAALDLVHHQPQLLDGETGLGMAPVPGLTVAQVNTFAAQVYYAANTIRSLTDALTAEGWTASDIWDPQQNRYADRFLHAIAEGYVPPVTDPLAAQLEPVAAAQLVGAYLTSIPALTGGDRPDWRSLDEQLLTAVEQLPRYYSGLSYQRDALLEMFRVWRKLDTIAAALDYLETDSPAPLASEVYTADTWLERALTLVRQVRQFYAGYPYQREALLGLVQQWGQFPARAPAIASLGQPLGLMGDRAHLDAALMARVQEVLNQYQGYGEQRLALMETFQLWHELGSRTEALMVLGIQPTELSSEATDPDVIQRAADQVDRALLTFLDQVKLTYQSTDPQRHALIQLTQRWRNLASTDRAVQSLFADLQRMERAQRESQDAPPRPIAPILPPPPESWQMADLYQQPLSLMMAIAPHGQFTWAEATRGGQYLPPNQRAIAAMIHMAEWVQVACDRLGRAIVITEWYQPEGTLAPTLNPYHRHALGEAIAGYVPGFTANQVYWALDPWWPGGLARYAALPYLIYLDLRPHRARWTVTA